jgi:hypothetical protein
MQSGGIGRQDLARGHLSGFGAVAQQVDRQRQGVVMVYGEILNRSDRPKPEVSLLAPSPAAAHPAVAA